MAAYEDNRQHQFRRDVGGERNGGFGETGGGKRSFLQDRAIVSYARS